MAEPARKLDAGFVTRALPPGSAHYFSHLFAAPTARPGLLGCYALMAEWQALLDYTVKDVAPLKIGWWQEEMLRLVQGSPRHPVSVYLAALGARSPELFRPLQRSMEAVALEASGVPLEQPDELGAHAMALIGIPLQLAAQLEQAEPEPLPTDTGLPALALGEYLGRSLRTYRREARAGRVPFVVAELLAAGIETRELAAATPSPALQQYLQSLRERAKDAYERSWQQLAPALRAPLRHQLVLATLGTAQLERDGPSRLAPLRDMLSAWNAARRAAR